MLGRKIQTLLEVSREAKRPLLVGTVILVFLSIFTKSQASSPFETLNSVQLSKSQMDWRPSVQKKLRTMAFSRVSTGDSDIPSSCEMKDGLHLRHCRESQPSLCEGISWSILLEAVNTQSLSRTYF